MASNDSLQADWSAFVACLKLSVSILTSAGNWPLRSSRFLMGKVDQMAPGPVQKSQSSLVSLIFRAGMLLYPSQARTLREQPLIELNQPVFITLPTSTGKSLLGEITLVASLTWDRSSRWLAVYLAPYRALTDQLQERMRSRLRRIDIRCVIRRGGYYSDMRAIDAKLPTVLVATPEAFDAFLRQRPELYKNIAACVFDEFHLIELSISAPSGPPVVG